MVTRPCHSVLSVGSSAFPCVTSECSAGVKQHDGLRVDSPPRREFLLHESASICPGECRAGALSNACASFHRPKKPEHAISRLPVGSLGVFRCLSPLWPRCASAEMRLIPNGLPLHRRLPGGARSCFPSDASHVVVKTLYSRACRIVSVRLSLCYAVSLSSPPVSWWTLTLLGFHPSNGQEYKGVRLTHTFGIVSLSANSRIGSRSALRQVN